MAKPPRPWIVTRHDPLKQLDDNVWEIDGDVPGFSPQMKFSRRMTIVRLSDGRLLFHNAVPVDEPALAAIRALGTPALLLVPHHLHAIDARAFREKLGVRVYSAAVSREKTSAIVPVDGTIEELPADPAFSVEALPSSRFGEVALVAHSGPRSSLILCDIVINQRHGVGLPGFMLRIMGFTGPEPRLPLPVRLRAFPDKARAKQDLLRLAAIPGLARVIPSHGPVIDVDPAGVLRRVSAAV